MMWRTVSYFFSVYFMFLSQEEAEWGAKGEGVTLPGDVILGEISFLFLKQEKT